MPNIRIRTVRYSDPRLAAASAAERAFLMFAGHAQNELSTLNKLMTWSIATGEGAPNAADIVQGLQALTIAKLLAGKLLGCWEELSNAYFRPRLADDPALRINDNAQAALGVLKAYFGQNTNLLKAVRNHLAFHYSVERLGEAWDECAREPGFELLVGDCYGNTYHRASEHAAALALLRLCNAPDRGRALEIFLDEVQRIALRFLDFFDGAVFAILRRHLGDEETWGECRDLAVDRDFNDVRIPYFTVMPGQAR